MSPSLESLSVRPGSLVPSFSPSRTAYAVALPAGAASIEISAVPSAPGSVVTVARPGERGREVSQPVEVESGRTILSIEVASAAGQERSVTTLKVVRAQPLPDWRIVSPSSPWAPRDSAGELVFNGRMWLLGGCTPALTSDVWSSANGVDWRRAGDVPTDAGINIPVAFALAGRMWVADNRGRLYASADGAAWSLELESPPWAGRYASGCAVHAGRAWVMGGQRADRAFNDVWSSADGRAWTEETRNASWSPRQLFGNVASHAGRLWVVGGGITRYEPFRSYRDVWCSDDGRRWDLVTEEAPWPGRIWSSCAVYRDRLWLLGGFRSQPTWNNWDDPWYSADGATWRRLESDNLWSARHELSAYVFDDALWVVAGNSWPLTNDVWRLRVGSLTFVTQPPVEEPTGLAYRYAARADFGDPAAVRYRLLEAPPWLAVDPGSGVVSGMTPEPGDFPVCLEAGDASGALATQRWVLHVIA